MRHTFFGGVFPATHKENTRRKPITKPDRLPEQVAIPMTMSPGLTAQPLVAPGMTVTVGQPIARPSGDGPVIHASISGTVTDIREHPHPWGGSELSIIIQNDGRDQPRPDALPPLKEDEITPQTLIRRVNEAGIVGMGGGAHPTADKLSAAMGKVDTLIINAAECEPYVTADHRLLLEHGDQILHCTEVLARCLGAGRAVLVTEGDKLNAAEVLEHRLRDRDSSTELVTLRTRYPLGAEKQIVQTATGREVPPGGNPIAVKCLVLNLATVYAVWEALFLGLPLTHRVVTVSGGALTRPRNLWVPIGTSLRFLLEECGGLKEDDPLMLLGGPMMGMAVEDPDAPLIKNTNALICLADWERKRPVRQSVCIRCGKCVAACPMRLVPTLISRAVLEGDVARLPSLHAEDCNECGCCSFICPAGLPLVEQMIRARELMAKGGEQ